MDYNQYNKIINKETDIIMDKKENFSKIKNNWKKTQKQMNFIVNILFYVSIAVFLIFLLSNKKSSINNSKTNTKIKDPLFTQESFDNYRIEEIKENINEKDLLVKKLPIETIVKVINNNTNITYLSKEMIKQFNNFTSICYEGKLIDNTKYPLVKKPKITVTIPIYNGGKYLYYSLRSIQNQKMKEIEIILLDDNSYNDTMAIIEEYMKEDERIRLIRNMNNRKILYSKSMAALNANGKYIIQLDQDDMFVREDIFDILYNEAEKFDLDLVQMRDFVKDSFYFEDNTTVNMQYAHIIKPKETHYKLQPELKNTMFRDDNNYLLWGMLIKTDLYKKAIYHLWQIIINYRITYQEDYTITFMIILLSERYKYLNNFALVHLSHSSATSSKFKVDDKFYLDVLFVANVIYDYYIKKYPNEIAVAFNYITYFQNWIISERNRFSAFTSFTLRRVFDNEYLSSEGKEYMKSFFNINDFEEYKIWNGTDYMENDIDEYKEILHFYYSNDPAYRIKTVHVETLISIVIPCYEFKYLYKTIKSIEKQIFFQFEIIIIYDNDDINDLNLIRDYIKDFRHIRFIINYAKKGLLYSISKGILSSKGKYILILEQSNTLATENALNEIFSEIHYENIDILEFNILINSNDKMTDRSLSLYKCSHFKSDIDLSLINYNKNTGIDIQKELLINKLIKAHIMKKLAEQFISIERTIFNYYDNIYLYLLLNDKYSFKHIDTFGVIQNVENSNYLTVSRYMNDKNQKIKDSIFYINFLFEKSNNTFEGKEFAFREYSNLLSVIHNKYNKITKESYTLYKKFMDCNYISKYNKIILQFYCTSLNN